MNGAAGPFKKKKKKKIIIFYLLNSSVLWQHRLTQHFTSIGPDPAKAYSAYV